MKNKIEKKERRTGKAALTGRIWKSKDYYLMLLPAVILVIMFNYAPLYGLQIAFKNYKVSLGVGGSPWIGLKNFTDFFQSYYFGTLLKNTLLLSLYTLVVGFPIPIIIALILNELKGNFKKFTQTVLYAPHFISVVVLVSILNAMLSPSQGVVNTILEMFGMERNYFMANPEYFRHLYVWSNLWQQAGYSAIIYIAALAGVSPELKEAAVMDGASRLKRIIHVDIPCILPTIIIMLILQCGNIVNIGFDKVFLMQNNLNMDVSEVISTYVYRVGIVSGNFGFSTAAGLFQSLVSFVLLVIVNQVSKKVAETSLW